MSLGLLVCLTILVQGCEPETAQQAMSVAEAPSFTVRDSAGVEIVTTDPSAFEIGLDWAVDHEPDLRLGASEGDVALHDVKGVTVTSTGGLVVVEGESASVWYFEPDGALARLVGSRGSGPGEFMLPVLVRPGSGGPAQIFDRGLRRFVLLDSAGTIREQVSTPGLIGLPVGMVGERVLVDSRFVEFPQGPGVLESEVLVQWVDSGSDEPQVVATVPVVQSWVVEVPGDLVVLPVPFNPQPASTVHGDLAVLTRGDAYRIEVRDLDGRLLRIMEVDAARTPVTDAHLEAYSEHSTWRYGPPSPSELARRYGSTPVPDSLPAFAALVEDATGELWAELYTIDRREASQWVVFDSSGRARGHVTMPPGLEVHEIGEDYVVGVARDEFGIEVVQRHRISRR